MTFIAITNTPASGTSLTTGWNSIASATDPNAPVGSVIWQFTPGKPGDPGLPNTTYDASIPGYRLMTTAEIAAASTANSTASTQYQADIAAAVAGYNAMVSMMSGKTAYPSTPQALGAALAPVLTAVFRIIDVALNVLNIGTADEQKPV